MHNVDFNYNTKTLYTHLLQHTVQIIDEMGYFSFNVRDDCVKSKFCFSICKDNSHENYFNYLALAKDLKLYLIMFQNHGKCF